MEVILDGTTEDWALRLPDRVHTLVVLVTLYGDGVSLLVVHSSPEGTRDYGLFVRSRVAERGTTGDESKRRTRQRLKVESGNFPSQTQERFLGC